MGFNDGIDHFKRGNYHNALNLTARNDHLHRHTQLIGVMQLFSYLESNLCLHHYSYAQTSISLLPLSPAHALLVPHWVLQVVTQSNWTAKKTNKKPRKKQQWINSSECKRGQTQTHCCGELKPANPTSAVTLSTPYQPHFAPAHAQT